MKKQLFYWVVAATLVMVLVTCKKNNDYVTGITLNQTTVSLTVGESITLTTTIKPDNATNKAVTWSSNATNVASVDQNGKITAVNAGTATITVMTIDGGYEATCVITVSIALIAVTGVTLKASTSIDIGGSETLIAIVAPTNATNKNVTWSSSNTSVATVSNGTITAVSIGTIIITVTTEEGNHTATCIVTVNPPPIGSESNPILIGTATELAALSNEVNGGDNKSGKYYRLTADINLSGYSSGTGWIPIGYNIERPFLGNFDGANHTVSNLKIDFAGYYEFIRVGLFGTVGGTIKNLGIVNVNIISGYNSDTGGVAGWGGKIENCYVTGIVSSNSSSAGGVVGRVNGNVENCYFMGTVSGYDWVGGVAGLVDINSRIENCYATGTVSGRNSVGGVVGAVNGSVVNCVALNLGLTQIGIVLDTNFGRVVGNTAGLPIYILFGNVAWNGMTVIGSVVSDSDKHGIGITKAQINADGTIGGRFTSAGGWTTQNSKLPGLFGQTVAMPTYLQ